MSHANTERDLLAEVKRRALRRAKECGGADSELVERAVRAAKMKKRPRWVAVKAVFGVGSTAAYALCDRFGLDPDERL